MATISILLHTTGPRVSLGDIYKAPARDKCATESNATNLESLAWGHMVLVLGQVSRNFEYWRIGTVDDTAKIDTASGLTKALSDQYQSPQH